jgi:DNA-binding LacI/PurR family transcriptional regulator
MNVGRISRHLMYQEVSDKIHELIEREGLWDQYLIPEREMARLFGVSRETVRRGLDLLERQGVVRRRHGQGTLVLPRAQPRAGDAKGRVVVGSYSVGDGGGYIGDMMAGLTSAAGRAGWLLSFSNLILPATRQEFFADLSSGAVDGVLLMSFTDRTLVEEVLRAWHGPLVIVDHYFEDLPVTGVIDDSEGGARQAVAHLLELGHRRVAYAEVTRRENNPWRHAGYVGALRDAGIDVDESLVLPTFGSFDGGRRAGEELLAREDPPTAVFAFDDIRAWGIWRAAEARGLEVGSDLALVGFGDSAAKVGFAEDMLSSVRFDSRALGRVAVDKMEELMSGKGSPGELIRIPTELVIRNSSRRVRAAGAGAEPGSRRRPGTGGERGQG